MSDLWIEQLSAVVEELGQAEVARRMECSSPTISQLRKGTYNASAETVSKWRERFLDTFSPDVVVCPLLGKIARTACAKHRSRPFAATNPTRVALHRTCPTCPNNPDRRVEDAP